MGIACDCSDDYDWFYEEDGERISCAIGRCYGCGGHIPVGEEVLRFRSYEMDEEGDEIPLGYFRICERCTGLYWSFIELGFCISVDYGFINEALHEYQNEYVRRPAWHEA